MTSERFKAESRDLINEFWLNVRAIRFHRKPKRPLVHKIAHALEKVRTETLEEAAKVCDEMAEEERGSGMPLELSCRIRALIDKEPK